MRPPSIWLVVPPTPDPASATLREAQGMIGQVLSHYRILEILGSGGMGVVYRARDERLDRDVALKVLSQGSLGDGTARKRLRREALLLSKLSHPHICMVFDFDSQ